MAKKTIQDFIEESQTKHPDKYLYDRCLIYTNNKAKMELFCKTCDVYFNTTANDHLGKKLTGCPVCGLRDRAARKSSMTYQKLLESSVEKHGAIYEILDDSDIYPGTYKLTLTCSTHGQFNMTVGDHLRKDKLSGGCQECSLDKRRVGSGAIKEYLEKASKHFGNKYNYSNIDINNIKNINQKVDIVCPVHGDFQQNFKVHFMLLSDCNKCSKTLTEEQIIKSIHKDSPKHVYTKNIELFYKNDSNFVRDLTVRKLICTDHNISYETSYRNLLGFGVGCPSCRNNSTSQYELEIINLLKELGYKGDIVQSYRPSWLLGKEVDIFIPDLNIAIEFNGSTFHHSSKTENLNSFLRSVSKDPSYHHEKWKACFENGVSLISVYDFYWKDPVKKEIYKAKFKHALGLDTKVYARKCVIKEISNSESKQFFEANHLEGSGFNYKDLKSYGMYYNDTLIMCASIGDIYNQSSKSWDKKLQRICTLQDNTVVGGISKLTSHLLKTIGDFKYQITLDSGGTSLKEYKTDLSKVTLRYFWVDPVSFKFHSRNYCQKSVLEKHFEMKLEPEDTENSYMERLGYLKVYDSGIAELQINKKNI